MSGGRDIDQVLAESNTVAVVGASRDPEKAGHRIPLELQRYGFRVVPVAPAGDELFGETVRHALSEIDDHVDVVNVFRPGEEAPEIARQAAAIGARVLWLQEGITSPEARKIAEESGMDFIEDRCMGAESRARNIRKQGAHG